MKRCPALARLSCRRTVSRSPWPWPCTHASTSGGRKSCGFSAISRATCGGPCSLVWDRGNPHKHQLVRAWLARHPRWEIVWFPPYAPDLNPVELLWSYLKYGRLANFAPDTVDEIQRHVGRERRRLGRRPRLLRSFFRHSALPFRV
jgi:transposase